MKCDNSFPRPPVPSGNYTISRGEAQALTIEARRKIFNDEKHQIYYEISKAAQEGRYSLEYKYSGNINNSDIEEFVKELESYGFKVEIDVVCDRLIISWYSEG